jgi:hypothetical protein
MEVNISPALKGSCDLDHKIKKELVVDIFNTIGFKIKDMEAALKTFNRKETAKPKQEENVKSIIKHRNTMIEVSPNDLKILVELEDEVK